MYVPRNGNRMHHSYGKSSFLEKHAEAQRKVEEFKKIMAARFFGVSERASEITWIGIASFLGKAIIYLNPLDNAMENEMQLEIAEEIFGPKSGYQYDMMGAFYYWFIEE